MRTPLATVHQLDKNQSIKCEQSIFSFHVKKRKRVFCIPNSDSSRMRITDLGAIKGQSLRALDFTKIRIGFQFNFRLARFDPRFSDFSVGRMGKT